MQYYLVTYESELIKTPSGTMTLMFEYPNEYTPSDCFYEIDNVINEELAPDNKKYFITKMVRMEYTDRS